MTCDEHVVRLLERALRARPAACDTRPAVIGEVPVQLLHPDVGRERQRDLRLSHFVRLRRERPSGPRTAGAPVERTSITVPASIADASAGAVAGSTTSVIVTSSDAPDSAPPLRPSTATTSASVRT